jgi:hypothetical protein
MAKTTKPNANKYAQYVRPMAGKLRTLAKSVAKRKRILDNVLIVARARIPMTPKEAAVRLSHYHGPSDERRPTTSVMLDCSIHEIRTVAVESSWSSRSWIQFPCIPFVLRGTR